MWLQKEYDQIYANFCRRGMSKQESNVFKVCSLHPDLRNANVRPYTSSPTCCITLNGELRNSTEHPGCHRAPSVHQDYQTHFRIGMDASMCAGTANETTGFQIICEHCTHPSDLVKQIITSFQFWYFLFCFVFPTMYYLVLWPKTWHLTWSI